MHACMHWWWRKCWWWSNDPFNAVCRCQVNLSNTCVCHVERVGESRDHSATKQNIFRASNVWWWCEQWHIAIQATSFFYHLLGSTRYGPVQHIVTQCGVDTSRWHIKQWHTHKHVSVLQHFKQRMFLALELHACVYFDYWWIAKTCLIVHVFDELILIYFWLLYGTSCVGGG